MASDETLFRFAPRDQVRHVDHRTLSMEALYARQERNGKHLWTVGLFFALDDPEASLDDMTCGAENLVCVAPIACAWCAEPYRSNTPIARRDLPCPDNQPQ